MATATLQGLLEQIEEVLLTSDVGVKTTETLLASLRERLGKIGITHALFIAGPEVDTNFKLAARNIPNVDVLPNAGLNVYDVLRRHTLVLTKDAITAINARFEEAA